MKIRFVFRFLFLIWASSFSFSGEKLIWASFRDRGWGVRAVGMGGAFSALADDGSALFWNPAGTSWIKHSEASFMWDRSLIGLTDVDINSGFLSYTVPTRFGPMGVGLTSFNASGLLQENMALVHYGHKIGQRASFGVNFKYLTHDFKIGTDPNFASNPVFANGTRESAVTVDAGVMFRPVKSLSFGFNGRNLTEPDVGLVSKDKVPAEYQIGAAWRPNQKFTFEVDGSYRNQEFGSSSDKSNIHVGVERWFSSQGRMASGIRAGFNTHQVTGGLSLNLRPQNRISYRLDYAFVMLLDFIGDQSGTHKVGFSIVFGKNDL